MGPNKINCTAKSGAGLSTSASGTVEINANFPPDSLPITGNASKTENKITVNPGGTQYGPYVQANKGCYLVNYLGGSNLNTYLAGFQAQEHNVASYSVEKLNSSSLSVHYYIYLSSNTSGPGLETFFVNEGSSVVEFTNIQIIYQGETCPK